MSEMELPYTTVGDSADREVWLASRRQGIGASEMAAIMGYSKWESALSVYARKVGVADVEEDQQSEAAYFGSLLERIVAQEFTRRTGMAHQWCGKLLRSAEHPWALATLDALCLSHPLECKTANQYKAGEWENGAPMAYVIQAHQQMLVTDTGACHVACLIGGQTFVWCAVEYDAALMARIVRAGAEFWNRVECHEPPEADGSESSLRALDALYPEHEGSVVLPGALIELDDEQQELKARVKGAEARLSEIKATIKQALGAHASGTLANGVSYKINKVKRAEHTVAASEYTTVTRKAGKR